MTPQWKILEQDVIDLTKGTGTPGSGNHSVKSDVLGGIKDGSPLRIECKQTDAPNITINLQWLESVFTHATREKETPLLAVQWNGGRAVILPTSLVPDMIENTGYWINILSRTFVLHFLWVDGINTTLYLPKIEVPNLEWTVISWEDFKEWCQDIEPRPTREMPSRQISNSQKLLSTNKLSSRGFSGRSNKLTSHNSFSRGKFK